MNLITLLIVLYLAVGFITGCIFVVAASEETDSFLRHMLLSPIYFITAGLFWPIFWIMMIRTPRD